MDIQDVARRANVSTATVSRVLNRSPKVKATTFAHVEQVIRELGYIPNTSARQLRVGRTRLFGLIISDINNPFFPELIDHFEELARSSGIDVIFSHTNYQPERFEHCLRRMIERNVDAVAVLTSESNSEALRIAHRHGLTFVLMNQEGSDTEYANIQTDYSSGMHQAVDHLYQLGHRRIGFISGPQDFDSIRARHEAFLDVIRQRRLSLRLDWIVDGDLHLEGGHRAMHRLLSSKETPTAVISINDVMAIGALQAAHETGLQVPRDLSIIGIDNLPLCEVVTPPLTSVNIPRKELARTAFDTLLQALEPTESADKPTAPVIPTNLVVRQSTAAPAVDGSSSTLD